jgi:CspA family cold shock protein
MPTGTVKWFDARKGFGFIRPQHALSVATPDVFVHISAVERAGLTILAEGQQIGYEIIENGGRLSADLKVLKKATDEAPRLNITLQSLGSSGRFGCPPTSTLWQMLDMVKLEDWDLARSLMTQELLKLDK